MQNRYTDSVYSLSFDKNEIEGSIPDRFAWVAKRIPERTALKAGNHSMTYAELDQTSDRIAQAILHLRGRGSEPVILMFGQDIEVIPAILGVLKAGKFYVALDVSGLISKLSEILKDTESEIVLTKTEYAVFAAELARDGLAVINIDTMSDGDEKYDLRIPPDALMGIFYTSGSTGKSKGLMRNHKFMLHYAWHIGKSLEISVNDHHTLLFPCSFGISTASIFGTLLNGATLHFYNLSNIQTDQMIVWLIKEKISIFYPPISLFRQFLDSLTEDISFPEIRWLIITTQTFYRNEVEHFRKFFSANVSIMQWLGMTEAGVITQFRIDYDTELHDDVVPVGFPTEDREILILDENRQKLGFNETGEIAVRSRYLSPGYWRNPELTAQKFLPDPEGGDRRIYLTGDLGRMRPDGCLELVGRKDFQVKIRGFRVETEAVEAALHSLESVKDAAVKAFDHLSGEKYLTAYIVPAVQPAPTVSAIRYSLLEKLPEYMIPSVFVMMEKLPLTSTGKTDRRALPEPDRIRPLLDSPYVPPSTEEEKQIAEIWAEILELDQVGIHDSFFELGGNSIQSMRIVSRIRQIFRTDLPMRIFFESPTVAEQAGYIIENRGRRPLSDAELEKIVAELELFSEEEAGKLLALSLQQGRDEQK
ncbi:MAG: non-ribosomal peptide synthetase [Desulfococcaceae bacterium]|jgi:amino acid adenylation domain-containing protein|nr:non-ribosomal peptide synthetase [Desulfococcaceae bacterium]